MGVVDRSVYIRGSNIEFMSVMYCTLRPMWLFQTQLRKLIECIKFLLLSRTNDCVCVCVLGWCSARAMDRRSTNRAIDPAPETRLKESHLIITGCPQPSIAVHCRIVTCNINHFIFLFHKYGIYILFCMKYTLQTTPQTDFYSSSSHVVLALLQIRDFISFGDYNATDCSLVLEDFVIFRGYIVSWFYSI